MSGTVADLADLSPHYQSAAYWADARQGCVNLPVWSVPPLRGCCGECLALGSTRISATAQRRTTKGGCLDLCSLHAEMWRAQDLTDLGVPTC